MVHDIRCVSFKGLDATFRNVVPDFDDSVVASRNDVEDVCAVLIVGLGRTEMDECLRETSGGVSQTDPGRSHPSLYFFFFFFFFLQATRRCC